MKRYITTLAICLLVLVVKPAIYSAIKLHINEVANSLTGVTDKYFNNVRIFSNHRQTKGK